MCCSSVVGVVKRSGSVVGVVKRSGSVVGVVKRSGSVVGVVKRFVRCNRPGVCKRSVVGGVRKRSVDSVSVVASLVAVIKRPGVCTSSVRRGSVVRVINRCSTSSKSGIVVCTGYGSVG